MLQISQIFAVDIPDAWFQCVSAVQEVGHKYVIDRGSYEGQTRMEFDYVTIHIKHPYKDVGGSYDAMLPVIPSGLSFPPPVASGYIEQYMPYLLTAEIDPGEQYTYGSRIYDAVNFWIKQFKKTPGTNQALLQVAQPGDLLLKDPPCLRHIDMRMKDGYLHFFPYFRSWDLWNGFPANLAAIAVLQKHMADEIGADLGEMVAASKGLHIYGYVEELAKLRCRKQ